DAHLTRGAFSFGVGDVRVPTAAAAPGPALPDVVARWTGLIGLFLLLGGMVTHLRLPVPEAAEAALRRRLYRLAVVATAAIAASGLFRLASDAAAIAGGTSLVSIAGEPLLRVLSVSHTGHDLIFRLVAAVFVTALLKPGKPVRYDGFVAILGLLLVGPVLTSHGLTEGFAGVGLSLLHILSASIWVGGLTYFGAVYLPVVHAVAPEVVRPAAVRFSRLAFVTVAVLIVTGLAQGYLYVGSPAGLTGPAYGRALLVKLIIIAPLLATAAINRWRILPRLARLTGLWRSLLVLVRVETALGLTVALLAAAVAISQPAKYAQSATITTEESRLTLGGVAGDMAVTMTLTPARQGANRIEVAATGADGRQISGEVRYLLRVVSLNRDLPAMTLRLDAGPDAKASGPGPFIGAPGWWGLELTVRRQGKEDASLTLPLLIDPQPPSANAPEAVALLTKAEKRFERVRTWQELEYFSPGTGAPNTTHYVFVLPDRLAYRTNAGSEGRVIGVQSYFREPGGQWTRTTRAKPPKIGFRFPLATDIASATLGSRLQEDDRTFQILTYDDPGGKLHFAAWIDVETSLPRRVFMVGEAHYMTSTMTAYNAPAKIGPP
ncbi:MAG: copper resistance D family protein, partial [Armatimonadota bacterium]